MRLNHFLISAYQLEWENFLLEHFVLQPQLNLKDLFQYIGLSLIISTAFIINENTIFPGVYAFIPCLGVGIIILSENKNYTI